MDAKSLSASKERTQVLWVLQLIEEQYKDRFSSSCSNLKDRVQIGIGVTAGAERYSLMMWVETIKLGPGDILRGNLLGLCQVENLRQSALYLGTLGNPKVMVLPALGPQNLKYGIPTSDPLTHKLLPTPGGTLWRVLNHHTQF